MPDGSHKGQAATHSTAEAPSAPPIVEDERQTVSNPAVGSAVYPDVAHIAHDGPQAQGRSEQVVPPYNEPPPAYHTVVNYPPYPSGSIPHGPPPCVPHYMPKPNPVPAYGTGPARPPPPAQITQVITVGIASVCPHCKLRIATGEELCMRVEGAT
ncbi:hypothetical protein Q1695_012693 [Nippostrongylus brasiliensis]|nr:hypothetical protein Q1695_012693 [Nippostrongylus brasiliensis]